MKKRTFQIKPMTAIAIVSDKAIVQDDTPKYNLLVTDMAPDASFGVGDNVNVICNGLLFISTHKTISELRDSDSSYRKVTGRPFSSDVDVLTEQSLSKKHAKNLLAGVHPSIARPEWPCRL